MNLKDGINKSFTTSPDVYKEESLCVYINGEMTEEYEMSENKQVVLFTNPPRENDIITISYFDEDNHLSCISF